MTTSAKLRLHKETLQVLHHDSVGLAGGATYATCVCSDACLTKQDASFCKAVTVSEILISYGGMC